MIAEIRWLIENKIVLANPEGSPLVDELMLASETLQTFIDESDAPLVHILIDESKLQSMPVSLKVLTDAFGFLKHPRLGWFIIYGNDDRMKKFISSMLTGITKVRHRRFDTIEESLQFLVTVDSTLPNVQVMMESISSSS